MACGHEHHHPRRLPGRGAQAALRDPARTRCNAKVFTNTVKGIGQLSVRLRDADVLVLIRERTHFPPALLEKLPRLKLISQTGRVGPHIDVDACTRLGIAVAEGVRLAGGAGRADLGADRWRRCAACRSTSATSSTAPGSRAG